MRSATNTRTRVISKQLFGNSYRLELLASIGELDGPFYARQLAARLDIADNLVAPQLGGLVELGLLEREAGGPHVLYTRRPSVVWEFASQVRAEFARHSVDEREHVVVSTATSQVAASGPAGTDIGALVRAAAASDQSAWNALVDRYSGLLEAIVRGYHLSPEDASDVVQTTWLRLAENINGFRDPSIVGGWLAATARRESLRVVRGVGREHPMGDDLPRPQDVDPGPGEGLMSDERTTAVRRAVSRLSEREQSLLRLLATDPTPRYDEIAATLGMPVGSIGPTRQRSLARLRHILKPDVMDDAG